MNGGFDHNNSESHSNELEQRKKLKIHFADILQDNLRNSSEHMHVCD